MIKQMLATAALSGSLALTATGLCAEGAANLSNLSKADFLKEYEAHFLGMLELSNTLAARMDPGLSDFADASSPVTEAERQSFECTYDIFAQAGETDVLIQHMSMADQIRARMEADPEFSYADFVLDEALMQEIAPDDTPTMGKAMSDCDMVSVSSNRMNIDQEFWAKLQEVGIAKGLVSE
ncbi:MAG: hypothetical protein OIF40_13240 [Mangrovicoccus sp.]|nr:hypothetical protein [Mangrovicoccus sp.]